MRFPMRITLSVVFLLLGVLAEDDTEEELPILHSIEVTVSNPAPEAGTCLTPTWIGIHDGRFDFYDRGEEASEALERLAEDGNSAQLSESFSVGPSAFMDFVVGDSTICPGENITTMVVANIPQGVSLYLSYAAMVLPSNDAFVGNNNPRAQRIFNVLAKPISKTFFITVPGSEVLDAGTEVNDEEPQNTPLFGQTEPNTGQIENGVIRGHEGFLKGTSRGILEDERFENADFTAAGYTVMYMIVNIERARTSVRGKGKGKFVRPVPVDSNAQCFIIIRFLSDGRLFFRMVAGGFLNKKVTSIEMRDSDGTVVQLAQGSDVKSGSRFMVRGVIRPGEMPNGEANEDVWKSLLTGEVFISVNTFEYPDGELRVNLP